MMRPDTTSLERRIERLWYGKSSAAYLLWPLSFLFGLVVRLRRAAYRSGIFRRTRADVPVIVVGNVTVGGAGKTPLVGWLAQRIADDGQRVGILSRGYGGSKSDRPRIVTADSSAAEVGDEAVLLARRTSACICVCPDRVAGARHLIDSGSVDIIVCDDGLQHYRLERDLEIAVVDGVRGCGNGMLLPAGPLREPIGRLRQVDFMFVNGGSEPQGRRFDLRPAGVFALGDDTHRPLDDFRGQRVQSVAGIGNPDRFAMTLRDAGIDPQPVEVPDHGIVDLTSLRRAQPWPILMTEKDAVKYVSVVVDDAWYVRVDVVMSPADESVFMERVRELYVQA